MKFTKLLSGLSLLLLVSCWGLGGDDDFGEPAMPNYEAVILERPAFESSVGLLPVQEVVKAGKIYIRGNFLFINEVNKGFHVYDYSDAQNPVPVAFIQALGATDVAVRANTLYINQAVDLLTVNYIAGENSITVTSRSRNVFPQKLSPDGMYGDVSEDEIIVDWTPIN